MKLSDLTPSPNQWEMIKGVEEDLLKRRRNSWIGLAVAVGGAVIQILTELSDSGLVTNLGQLFRPETWESWFDNLDVYNLVALLLLAAGLLTWFLLRHTRVMMRDSKDPFRYTFWVEPFECIGAQVEKKLGGDDDFHPHDERLRDLLHHDLTNHLSNQIRRLSVLDGKAFEKPGGAMRANIRIKGHYTCRVDKRQGLVLEVMPRVQIGSPETPWHLTHPVTYQLEKSDQTLDNALNVNQYDQIVERVYSRVATEVYNRIMSDVKEKVNLFPTNYLRAVALSVEAEDFARSNTIDAYDHAIELYKLALRYFRISTSTYFYRFTLSLPGIRTGIRYHHNLASIEIGYAKCLIYKWYISTLSGRQRNSLFSVPQRLREIVVMLIHTHNKLNSKRSRLQPSEDKNDNGNAPKADPGILKENRLRASMAYLTFPEDTWWRSKLLKPSQSTYERQKKVLFEAFVVRALALNILGYTKKAGELLENAKAVNPSQSDRNPLFLMASGVTQSEIEPAITNLRKATELAPDFEIVQYLLAMHLEKRFRNQNELTMLRARNVLEEYEKTLQINHGNIASLAAQGYIYWLIGDKVSATRVFEEGLEYKKIVKEIYPGELYYGLARILTEELKVAPSTTGSDSPGFPDKLNKAFEYFSTAMSLDPGTGMSYPPTSGQTTTDYYEFITPAILNRYAQYKETMKDKLRIMGTALGSGTGQGSLKRKDALKHAVFSYVLNDYGNACLNFYYRFGEWKQLENARDAFLQATEFYPESKVAWMGLSSANASLSRFSEELETTAKAAKLNQNWGEAILSLARAHLYPLHDKLEKRLNAAVGAMNEIIKIRNSTGPMVSTDAISGTGSKKAEAPELGNKRQSGAGENDPLAAAYKIMNEEFKTAGEMASLKVKEILERFTPIVRKTQFSSLYQGYGFDEEGNGIEDFIEQEVQKDRLNEDDVNALKMYAEIVSHNVKSDAFIRALKLLDYIDQHYLTTDFNILRNIEEMSKLQEKYRQVQKFIPPNLLDGNVAYSSSNNGQFRFETILGENNDRIKQIVRSWVEYDPLHYSSVWWCQIYLSRESYQPILKAAQDATSMFEEQTTEGLNRLLASNEYDTANLEIEEGKFNVAAERMEKVIRIDASNQSYLKLFIQAWNAAPDFKLEKGLKLIFTFLNNGQVRDIDSASQIELLKNVIGQLPKPGDAIPVWDFLLKKYAQAMSQADLAASYLGKGKLHRDADPPDFQQAKAAITKALEIDYADPEVYNEMGVTYYRSEQFQQAIPQFQKAYDLRDSEPVYLTNIANSYEKLQQPDKAESWFDKAVKQAGKISDKEKAKFLDSFGRYSYRNGKYQEAAGQFKEAFEHDGSNGLYSINQGDSLKKIAFTEADIKNVENAYKEGIKAEPENSGFYNILGIFYFERGSFKNAAEQFRLAIIKNDQVAVYYLNHGDAFMELSKWKEASEVFEKGATLVSEPDNKVNYVNKIGLAYYRDQHYKQAKAYFEEAVQLKPTEFILYANVADAALLLKEYGIAEDYYRQSLALNGYNINATTGLGRALFYQHHYGEALKQFVKAHYFQPNDENIYFNLWSAALRLRDTNRSDILVNQADDLKDQMEKGIKGPYTEKLIALLRFLARSSRFSSAYLASYFGLLSTSFTYGFKQGWQKKKMQD